MKTYSNDAVTASEVSALDEKQSREIKKIKQYIVFLMLSQFVFLLIGIAIFLLN